MTEKARFAGGCFWCIEAAFDGLEGVEKTSSGYTGGTTEHPTYEQVCTGQTGYIEAVEIHFEPSTISYEALLDFFWRNIDPTDHNGQFADRGSQYQTAIFYFNTKQKKSAEASKKDIEKHLGQNVVTAILPASTFYPAEEAHQKYHQKNPTHYERYKYGSGRSQRLQDIWKKTKKD